MTNQRLPIPNLPIVLIVACFVLIAATFSITLLDEATIIALTAEDALVENYGGLFFLVASFLFFLAYYRSSGYSTHLGPIRSKRNLVYLVLALMFLFAGGEEISWGQRVFGWETPESMAEYNRQGEMNIHNLAPFQGGEEGAINLHFLFSLFWVSYCVMLPLLNRVPVLRDFFAAIGLPVTSLWIGGLLIMNYALFKLVGTGFEGEARHGLNELKESNAAFAWALVGLLEYLRMNRRAEASGVAAEASRAPAR